MHDNNNINDVREVSLDDLVSGITNHNKLLTAEATLKDMSRKIESYEERIKFQQIAGDRLAFLMLNGTTIEMKKAIWEWRELNPKKEKDYE
jgi:hypothetical protein